ncbi:MAG: BatA domain-containing protein [Planctomycetota bacterium]
MTFLHPLALLGLLLLPLLILLERWRRRARPTLWPSLVLWRVAAVAEAPARRRIEPLLLYECAAVLLLSLAAAGPAWSAGRTARKLPVLLDEGPHMHARRADGATALEATRAEVARMGDVVEIHPVIDLARAAAGWPDDGVVVLATSLPDVEGPRRLVVGRAPAGDNLGIDAVRVDGDRLWFALATDGATRTVDVAVGDDMIAVPTGQGVTTDFARSIEILDADNYDGDNRVRLRRLALVGKNDTRSDLVRLALFEAGVRARPGDDPDLILTDQGGTPVEALVRGADCVAADPLFDGLLLDECVWEHPRTLPGDGLLLWRGRALAKWTDARTLWLGLPVDRDWDDHDTLAVLIERAKRARVQLGEHEALVGDAIASPPPGHVWTKGVDRPWDGTRPATGQRVSGARGLRATLALLAALVLALYLRASRAGR